VVRVPVSVLAGSILSRTRRLRVGDALKCRPIICPTHPRGSEICKIVTGTGKSTVAAMNAAWSILNKVATSMFSEVAPVSWTPEHLCSRSPRWPRHDYPTHPRFVARWWNWWRAGRSPEELAGEIRTDGAVDQELGCAVGTQRGSRQRRPDDGGARGLPDRRVPRARGDEPHEGHAADGSCGSDGIVVITASPRSRQVWIK
jgi:hypothetical protein